MGLETATYISSLVTTNPVSEDGVDEGDDHLRLIKSVLQNTLTGVIVLTGTEAQGATVNDYVLTVSPAPTGYVADMVFLFKANHTNTSTATFKLAGLSALPFTAIRSSITWMGGEVVSGDYVAAIYDSGSASVRLLSSNDAVSRNGDTMASLTVTGALAAGTLAVSGTATGVTPTAGDNSTKFATTAFVVGLGMSALLPGQTGRGGLPIRSDGTTADWGATAFDGLALQRAGVW